MFFDARPVGCWSWTAVNDQLLQPTGDEGFFTNLRLRPTGRQTTAPSGPPLLIENQHQERWLAAFVCLESSLDGFLCEEWWAS